MGMFSAPPGYSPVVDMRLRTLDEGPGSNFIKTDPNAPDFDFNNWNPLAGAMRPNVGIGMPVERPGQPGFGPAPIDGQNFVNSEPNPVQPPAPQTPVPGFQTTWQQLGYSSLEAMKDAMDPGWRNSNAQLIGGSFDSPIYGRFLGQPGGDMTPAPMPMPNQPAPIAEQVREQVASPIYGQGSPFQPPTPQQQMPAPQPPAQVQPPPQLPPAQMPVPQLPPSMPYTPRPDIGPGVGIGVPAQPAFPNASAFGSGGKSVLFSGDPERRNVSAPRNTGSPLQGTPLQGSPQQFTGGLKPAPRNFRPPRRVGSLRARTQRR